MKDSDKLKVTKLVTRKYVVSEYDFTCLNNTVCFSVQLGIAVFLDFWVLGSD